MLYEKSPRPCRDRRVEGAGSTGDGSEMGDGARLALTLLGGPGARAPGRGHRRASSDAGRRDGFMGPGREVRELLRAKRQRWRALLVLMGE